MKIKCLGYFLFLSSHVRRKEARVSVVGLGFSTVGSNLEEVQKEGRRMTHYIILKP